jgi:cytidylate kinase
VLADPELRTEATGALASRVSAHACRACRADGAAAGSFAHQPGGAVLDGRDIGTVIAPEAGAKLYVTASPRVSGPSAVRREMERHGPERRTFPQWRRRSPPATRAIWGATTPRSPKAQDADLLDTSELGIDEAIQRAIALVDATD